MIASFFCTRGNMFTDGYCYAVFRLSLALTKYYKADELVIANKSNYLIYYYLGHVVKNIKIHRL